jgi:hypothetical protein
MENEAKAKTRTAEMTEMQHVLEEMIDERMSDIQVVTIFKALDTDGSNASMVQLTAMFQEADLDGSGTLDLHEVSFQLINLDSHRVTFSYSTLDYSTPLQFIQLAKIAPLDLLANSLCLIETLVG